MDNISNNGNKLNQLDACKLNEDSFKLIQKQYLRLSFNILREFIIWIRLIKNNERSNEELRSNKRYNKKYNGKEWLIEIMNEWNI